MLLNNSSKPLYLQLEADIKQAIRNKKYMPGDRLPSEEELCEHYQVSRITVRKAIQNLTDQHLLEKHRGKGTFVAHSARSVEIGKNNGFTSYITGTGHQSRHLILAKELRAADEPLREKLRLEPGEPTYYVKRLFFKDDLPFGLDEIYLSSFQYPGFLDRMTNDTSFYEILDSSYGVTRGESVCELISCIADASQSGLLKCQTGDPLFLLHKVCYDTSGDPIHYSRSLVRGDCVTYTIKTTAAEVSLHSRIEMQSAD